MTGDTLVIRRAGRNDLDSLVALTVRAFHQAYDGKSPAPEIDAHIARHFTNDKLVAEITDPDTIMLLADSAEGLLGYALLRVGSATPLVPEPGPVELCRIYFDAAASGRGHGSALMPACLEAAREKGGGVIWLSVWEENHAAIRFYERWGFRRVGTQPFDFGGTWYEDPIMSRLLA
ncbi:MAG TPA: N-acetyltransferase [Candidatus Eisenbacteria bacterium]